MYIYKIYICIKTIQILYKNTLQLISMDLEEFINLVNIGKNLTQSQHNLLYTEMLCSYFITILRIFYNILGYFKIF